MKQHEIMKQIEKAYRAIVEEDFEMLLDIYVLKGKHENEYNTKS